VPHLQYVITRPEESYRLWSVVVCDLETSRMRRSWPLGGCWGEKNNYRNHKNAGLLYLIRYPVPSRQVSFLELSTNFPEGPGRSGKLAIQITRVRISVALLYSKKVNPLPTFTLLPALSVKILN
jgi:hypothetical protein